MTAQSIEQPTASSRWPAKTLDALVRVFAGDVDAEVRDEFLAAVEAAGAAAKAASSFEPLATLVEAWWPQAVFWSEPVGARETLARMERYRREGLPKNLVTREQAIAGWEAKHGRKLGL